MTSAARSGRAAPRRAGLCAQPARPPPTWAPLVRGFSLPHVAGMDVAGVVVGHGDGVDASLLPIGTAVVVDPVSTCGHCRRCVSGKPAYCENLRTVGSTRPGGFAELVAVPAAHAFRRARRPVVRGGRRAPRGLPHGLARTGRRRAGAGRREGARQRRRIGREHGRHPVGEASGCVRRRHHRWTRSVRSRVRARVRCGGGSLCRGCLRRRDRRLGWWGRLGDRPRGYGAVPGVDRRPRRGRAHGLLWDDHRNRGHRFAPVALPLGPAPDRRRRLGADELGDVLRTVDSGGLRPVIDSVWPFAELDAAQAYMAAGGFFGKIVVELG